MWSRSWRPAADHGNRGGAVPVVVDVPVIKQRRGVSPTVKCLKFSSSWRLRTFQLCNRDGFSVLHWVAVLCGYGFFRIFRAPPGCPGVERQFFGALDDEEFFVRRGLPMPISTGLCGHTHCLASARV